MNSNEKVKRGRKPLPQEERSNKLLYIRVTEAEFEKMKSLSKAKRMATSTFARQIIFESKEWTAK